MIERVREVVNTPHRPGTGCHPKAIRVVWAEKLDIGTAWRAIQSDTRANQADRTRCDDASNEAVRPARH